MLHILFLLLVFKLCEAYDTNNLFFCQKLVGALTCLSSQARFAKARLTTNFYGISLGVRYNISSLGIVEK